MDNERRRAVEVRREVWARDEGAPKWLNMK
jgi:hypothetical protein